MANYFQGDEIKFAIDIQAEGFDMNTDDFDIEVASGRTIIKASKGDEASEDAALVIFKEVTTIPPSGQDEETAEEETVTTWYAIIDTTTLPVGTMVVAATAYIVDANANDGVRRSISTAQLGRLVAKF